MQYQRKKLKQPLKRLNFQNNPLSNLHRWKEKSQNSVLDEFVSKWT